MSNACWNKLITLLFVDSKIRFIDINRKDERVLFMVINNAYNISKIGRNFKIIFYRKIK